MAAAEIEINGVAGSNDDLPLDTLVQLSNADVSGELTYAWSIVDQPTGGTAALSNPAIENPTFTPDVEGTYLLRLVVNAGLGTEVIATAIAAVRDLRSFEREPAAGELLEADTARGWAIAQNRINRRTSLAATDSNIVAAVNNSGGTLAAGSIVQLLTEAAIKVGLPGEEHLLEGTQAAAAASATAIGTLGVVIGAADGGAWADGSVGLVRIWGLAEWSVAGAPVVGALVYLSDAGLPALTPGTVGRVLGKVVSVDGGGTYRWVIEGRPGVAQPAVKAINMLGASINNTNAHPVGQNGYVEWDVGTAVVSKSIDLDEGDTITSVAFARYGDGSADFSAIGVGRITAGGVVTLLNPGGIATVVSNPAAAWADTVIDVTDTALAAGDTLFIYFNGSAVNLRVAGLRVSYTPRPR